MHAPATMRAEVDPWRAQSSPTTASSANEAIAARRRGIRTREIQASDRTSSGSRILRTAAGLATALAYRLVSPGASRAQIDLPLGAGAGGGLEGAGPGSPGRGNGRLDGNVMTGPTPELVGDGNGFGIPGNPEGNGNGEPGSAAEGAALAEAEGCGFGADGPGPGGRGVGFAMLGVGERGDSGARGPGSAVGGAADEGDDTGATDTGGGGAALGVGCGDVPLELLTANATTMPPPRSTGNARRTQSEAPDF
jgi:hypothetical protein